MFKQFTDSIIKSATNSPPYLQSQLKQLIPSITDQLNYWLNESIDKNKISSYVYTIYKKHPITTKININLNDNSLFTVKIIFDGSDLTMSLHGNNIKQNYVYVGFSCYKFTHKKIWKILEYR